MDRRIFIKLAVVGSLASARGILAERHVVSAVPLIVESDLSTLEGPYTAIEDFYVRNHWPTPKDSGTPILRVDGEVEKPQAVQWEDLASSPKRKLGAVLECAGNPVRASGLVSNGLWEGWPLGIVLRRARPLPSAKYIHLLGRDLYVRSVPVDRAYIDGMLVTHLNGRPLRRQQGAPWRALFPGWYGMDSVKWLQAISLSSAELPSKNEAYLELTQLPSGGLRRQQLPRVQVKSIIIRPTDGSVLKAGRATIQGVAWSGEGKISTVEVSGDRSESWQSASIELGADFEWALWRTDLELRRGVVELACRTTDEKGIKQPEERDPSRLDGYVNNWYHRVRCVIV